MRYACGGSQGEETVKLNWIKKMALNQVFGVKTGKAVAEGLEAGDIEIVKLALVEWFYRNKR
jgi:hypothetical protein